jgi:flavin reductase (DIM6/NTAB) family NADH-FMN oxidoreductase RutF
MTNRHDGHSAAGRRIERTEDDLIQEAMHELPYGIYIVGTAADGRPNAMIADWVMQVSFRPRLLAVAFERDSSSLARIRQHPYFTVNLLNQEGNGMALAARFVQPADASKVKGRSEAAARQRVDKLEGVAYHLAQKAKGCPVIDDALAVVECSATEFVDAGDHVLVLGTVLGAERLNGGEPLTSTFTGWVYSG